MAPIGDVPHFYYQMANVEFYTDQLEHFFDVNNIDEEDLRKTYLLSCLCAQSFRIVKQVCEPGKPRENSFEELIEILKTHCCRVQNSDFLNRLAFYKAKQNDYAKYSNIKCVNLAIIVNSKVTSMKY